jgi:superfamily II DNA or RNA helicase
MSKAVKQRIHKELSEKDYLRPLYPHQKEAYLRIALEYAAGHTGVGVRAETGFGKSVLARTMVRSAYERLVTQYPNDIRKKILWLGENDHIIRNGREHCLKAGIPEHDVGVIKAYRSSSEFKFDVTCRVQVASIQTLNSSWEDWRKRGLMPCMDFQFIVVDEFHHFHNASQMYASVAAHYPKVRKLGLSATPEHKSGFDRNFTSLVLTENQRELAAMGYQPRWESYGIAAPIDRTKLAINTEGEFTQKAADEAAEALIKGDILKTWYEHVAQYHGRVPTILFAQSVAKSKEYADEINRTNLIVDGQPVRAVHIDGSMKADQLADALREFASGRACYLINCAKVTEGFDLGTVAESLGVPLASVGCVQDLSFVRSVKRHKQKVGRARGILVNGILTAFYLDHVGATGEHGYPDTPYEWTLTGKAQKAKGEPPTKLCPPEDLGCGRWINRFLPKCPHCGYDGFPIELEPELEAEDLHDREYQLVKLQSDNLTHFEALLSSEKTKGWAIGEFVKYSPSYQEMLQACRLADVDASQALQRWVEGQRIAKQDYKWLPKFANLLEILKLLAERSEQKAWKKVKYVKPLHTYRAWIILMRVTVSYSWKPSMEELLQIQKACGFSDKWAWAESQQQIARRGA